jgi:hypothetical protein
MSDDPTIEDVLLKWENGEETNEVMQAVISAHDAATKEQKALVPEKTLRRLDLAASKLSLARKKAAEKVVAFPDFRAGGRMDDKEIEGMVPNWLGFPLPITTGNVTPPLRRQEYASRPWMAW